MVANVKERKRILNILDGTKMQIVDTTLEKMFAPVANSYL